MAALTPERKALYDAFCARSKAPLHFQSWWLEAVCGPGQWGLCTASDGAGKVHAAMPYYLKKRWGLLPEIALPPLTTYAGPWYDYPEGQKLSARYGWEKKVVEELVGQLPFSLRFSQNFSPEIGSWLPFYWQGFQETTRYTYVFDSINSWDVLEQNMDTDYRKRIKKAENAVQIEPVSDLAAFFEINKRSFSAQKKAIPYTFETLQRLDAVLADKQQRLILRARDRQTGQLHAATYLAWHEQRAYCLLTGIDPAHRDSQAIYLLYAEALQACAAHALAFDFEGSMLPGVEQLLRGFGARQQGYSRVWRWFL